MPQQTQTDRVLVTGVSGFLGGHVALALLQAGYRVRGSVRDLKKADAVRAALAAAGAPIDQLDFVVLDLLADAGWAEAAKGCRYVQHTASPFVLEMPKDPDELIRPAVEGTRRALRAGLEAGAERIVLTSSIAAVVYGHPDRDQAFTAADWTQPDQPGVTAYARSKTLAEREAWAIMDAAGARDRLAVVNPGAILGPLLDDDPGTSGLLVKRLLEGSVPAAPRIALDLVDVRDVAALHVAAMQAPDAGGRRFIATQKVMSFMEVAQALRAAFPREARRVPRFELPDFLVRLHGLFDRALADNVIELGKRRRTDSSAARTLLGRDFIAAEEAARAMGRSLIARNLV